MRKPSLSSVTLAAARQREPQPAALPTLHGLQDVRLISTDGREVYSMLDLIERASSKVSHLKREEVRTLEKKGVARGPKRKRRLENRVARLRGSCALATSYERELRQLRAELLRKG